jgi:hypothetical protein
VDALFDQVAAQAPSFAGMFVQNDERVMWVTDTTRPEAPRGALGAVLAARGLGAPPTRVRLAQYAWSQLSEWQHKHMLSILALDGVVFTDADETINRIRIGIESADVRASVLEAIRRLGIPVAAIVIEVTSRPVAVATLLDRMRPLSGGLRIVNSDGGGCTLGFNVDYSGTRTFMTNSHCTDAFGSSSGQAFYQSALQSGDFVGNEYLDPALKNYGTFCPPGRTDCRWSDAALVQYDAGAESTPGGVARTSWSNQWNGSTTIVRRFWISGKEVDFAGQTINKMGSTTGWTGGTVDATCVHYDMGNRYLMCQGRVNAGVYFGDSGSPVFRIVSGDEIKLLGILWGGHPVGTTQAEAPRFLFSPIGGIEEDFNTALSVTGDPATWPRPTPVIDGPTSVKPNEACSWFASAFGGAPPYTFQWTANGMYIGSGSEIQYTNQGSSFTLGLTATDVWGASNSTSRWVTVSASAPRCFL